MKIETLMRLTPAEASRLTQEAKVRRDQREAAERAEAERRAMAIQRNEERFSKERARLDEGLKDQTRKILISALEGKQSLTVLGEIFDLEGLQRKGFFVLYRRPLRAEESLRREASIRELEDEIESLLDDIESAKAAWSHGICCQSERIDEGISDQIDDGIESAVRNYIDLRTGASDFYERSDGYSVRSDEIPEDFFEFMDPSVVCLIPGDVEWRSLTPEVPSLRRAIDRLVTRRPEVIKKILSYKKQITDGILIDRPFGGPDQIFEITWERGRSSEKWENYALDEVNGVHWISGVFGQELLNFIDESIEEVIDQGEYSLLNLRLRQPDWHNCSLSDEYGYQSFPAPPAHVLVELLRLLGWTVEAETPDESETYLSVSW